VQKKSPPEKGGLVGNSDAETANLGEMAVLLHC